MSAGGTPSIGGSAQANVPSNFIGDAVNTALATKRLNAEIKNIQADTDKKKSEWALNDNLGANAAQQNKLLRIQQGIATSQASSAKSQAIQDMADAAILKTPIGIRLKALDYFGRSLNPFTSSAKNLK